MKWNAATASERWHCLWCGRKSLSLLQGGKSAKCSRCKIAFRVSVEALPDPNCKHGRTSCGSKREHADLEAAIVHGTEIWSKPNLPHKPRETLSVYRCKYCPSWHVGHVGKETRLTEYYLVKDLIEANASAATPNVTNPKTTEQGEEAER